MHCKSKTGMNFFKKLIFLFIAASYPTIYSFSQKEIYFDKVPEDSVRVKRLHGFDIGYYNSYNPKHDFWMQRNEIQLNYWHEIGLGAFSSIILKAGVNMDRTLFYVRINQTKVMVDTIGNYMDIYNGTRPEHRLYGGAHFTVEPRWYLAFKKRLYANKAQLNQGWYISLPIEIVGTTSEMYWDKNKPLKFFNVHKFFTPTLGYRKALTKHLLVEGTIGFLVDPFTSYNSVPEGIASSIKIGYAF